MCGRFALDLELDELITAYQVEHNRLPDWAPRWNIAPTQSIPIVLHARTEGAGFHRIIGPARWSLTPASSPTLELRFPTFNARAESAGEKPTFRDALAHHRALIPATAYYEWHTEGKIKTPFAIYQEGFAPMAFAGLYSTWSNGSQTVVTATLLTTDAPAALRHIHPRSPVVIGPEHWSGWLDPQVTLNQKSLNRIVDQSRPSGEALRFHPVNPLRGDGPELLAVIDKVDAD